MRRQRLGCEPGLSASLDLASHRRRAEGVCATASRACGSAAAVEFRATRQRAARSNQLRADHAVERVTETVDLGPARNDKPCRVARVDQLEIDALKAMAELLHFATSRAGALSEDER